MTSSGGSPTLNNYFLLADRLRRAIRSNRRDTTFAEKGTIVYLTDTNMAEFYLRGEGRYLRGQMALTRLMKPSAAEATQDLTLKFIMSGNLPGQREPLLMSPTHWNEIIERLRVIKRDAETKVAATNGSAAARNALPDLKRLAGSPAELINTAEKIGLSKLLDAVRHASEVSVRMKLAFQGASTSRSPKLRGIERTDWWHTLANRTRTDDYRQWRLLLVRHQVKSSGANRSQNIDADAQTLAGIEALYRENPESTGPHAKLKFLFLTADRAIIRAAEERQLHLQAEGIDNFVREPLVYIPLINFSALYRSASETDDDDSVREAKAIFGQVEAALHALFPFSAGTQANTKAAERQKRWNLRENVNRWSDAAETIALVNSKLFIEGTEAEEVAARIAEIFSGDDIVLAAGDAISSTISEIKDDHALNMSMVALDHIINTLKKASENREEVRPPTKIWGVDLYAGVRKRLGKSYTPSTTFAFNQAIFNEHNPQRVSEIAEAVAESLRESWRDAIGQLLAATIYLGGRAWESAASCASRCYELAGSGPTGSILRREAAYCRAVSFRMMLRSEQDVQEANRLLSENIANSSFDAPVVALRDAVERWTLLTSACIVQTIQEIRKTTFGEVGAPELVKSDVPTIFDQEVRHLDGGIQTLLNNWLGTDSESLWFVSDIVRQATGNRLGAELARYYLGDRISVEPCRLPEVLAETEKTYVVLGVKVPLRHPVPRGYMAAALYEMGRLSQAEALQQLHQICSSPVLTDADKLEFDFIKSKVERGPRARSNPQMGIGTAA